MDYSIYFVPTPIGNLEDMTFRAVNTLKEVDIIACEDTRESLKLLGYYKIKKPLTSYHKFNEIQKSEEIIEKAKQGVNFAVITDQGMPGISDPGHLLIKRCIEENISYTILPGASSIINALVGSGFKNDTFSYYGFIPKKNSQKNNLYQILKTEEKTSIILDTPHNITNTLSDFKDIFPERMICIARELTKKFEEYKIYKLKELDINEIILKGEFIIILSGNEEIKDASLEDYKILINEMKANGDRTKDIVKRIKEVSNFSKNDIYEFVLSLD